MAWSIINPISADTESVDSMLLTQILDNLLASGANNVVATGDLLYGLVDDAGERSLSRLTLAGGTRNNVTRVGNNSTIEWSGLGVNVDYSSYIREGIPVLDSEFVTETSGLALIEVVQNRIPSNLISATVDSAQFEYETIANLGDLTPSVERYVTESAALDVKSVSDSNTFNITTDTSGNYIWFFGDSKVHRIGFITIGSAIGTSVYYILDVVDGDRVPDFDLLPSNEGDNLGNRNKLSTTFEFSKSEIESLVADDSFVFEGYFARSSLNVVTGLTVTSTVSSATLNWSPVTGASQYQVQYKQSSSNTFTDIPTSPVGSNSATIGGLLADTRYVYRVRALSNMAISGDWSDELESATMTPTLGRVTGVAFTSYGQNSLSFSWSAVPNATSYSVEYKRTTSSTWSSAGSTNSTSDTISSLQSNTSYNIRIKATAPNYVDGAWSFVVTGSTLAPRLPTPTGLSLSIVDDNYIRAVWNSVSNASSYTIQWVGNETGSATVTSTSYRAGPFTTGGGPVSIYIRANSNSSSYRNSNYVSESITIPLPPPEPTKLPAPTIFLGRGAFPVRGTIMMSWTSVTNATHYMIRVRNEGREEWLIRDDEYTGTSYTFVFDNDIYGGGLPDWTIEIQMQAIGDSTTTPSDWSNTASINVYPTIGALDSATVSYITNDLVNNTMYVVCYHSAPSSSIVRCQIQVISNDVILVPNDSPYIRKYDAGDEDYYISYPLREQELGYTYSYPRNNYPYGDVRGPGYDENFYVYPSNTGTSGDAIYCRVRNVPQQDSIYVVSEWTESDIVNVS